MGLRWYPWDAGRPELRDPRERGARPQCVRAPDAVGGRPARQPDYPESFEGRLQLFQNSLSRDGARWKDQPGYLGEYPAPAKTQTPTNTDRRSNIIQAACAGTTQSWTC